MMEEWYYTRNGQQEGPVNLETLRNLAQQGGLDRDDLVWNSSMKDWTPASQVAGIFSSVGQTTSAPTSADASGTAGELTEIVPGSDGIDIGACVSRGLELTKRHFMPLLGIMVVYIISSIVIGLILGVVDRALGIGGWQTVEFFGQRTTQYKASLLNQLISNIASIYLSLGLIRIGLNIVDGKPFELGQMFSGGQYLINAIGAAILFFLMILAVMLPTIILIVMGLASKMFVVLAIPVACVSFVIVVCLSLRYGFYMMAIVDKGLGPIEALKYSSQITTSQRLNLFLLSLVMFLIVLAGLICLVVGVLFAAPVAMLAWVVAYRWTQYGRCVIQE